MTEQPSPWRWSLKLWAIVVGCLFSLAIVLACVGATGAGSPIDKIRVGQSNAELREILKEGGCPNYELPYEGRCVFSVDWENTAVSMRDAHVTKVERFPDNATTSERIERSLVRGWRAVKRFLP